MSGLKVVVIGSGVAGMATAIRLAVQGHHVDVFEKNSYPGGKLSAFEQNGFLFDAGPSLFTQPKNIEALFELAEENIADYFTYLPIDIACKYFYENGKVLEAFTNPVLFAQALHEQLGELPEKTVAYLKESQKIYNNIAVSYTHLTLPTKRIV